MAANKRARTRSAAKRAAKPTYAQLEERLRDSERRCSELEDEVIALKARLAGDAQGAAAEDDGAAAEEILTEEEQQGERWKELFVSSDVFREHIQPELGETWTAILMEACGQATSKTDSQVERKRMDAKDAMRSASLYQWCCARGYVRQVQHNEAHVTKVEAAEDLNDALAGAEYALAGADWHGGDWHGGDWHESAAWEAGNEVACERRFTMQNAAMWGDIALIKFLRKTGCPWDDGTCAWAAVGGQLDVLKYLHENGCPWNEMTCSRAAQAGHLDVLKYAHENGCPWNLSTCSWAAEKGHLNVLKYAHENGCPWHEWTCRSAAKGGYLDVLKYARENGCPWNKSYCLRAARNGGHQHIVAWIESQAPIVSA